MTISIKNKSASAHTYLGLVDQLALEFKATSKYIQWSKYMFIHSLGSPQIINIGKQ